MGKVIGGRVIVPRMETKPFLGIKPKKRGFIKEMPEVTREEREIVVPRMEAKPFLGIKPKKREFTKEMPGWAKRRGW